MKKQITILGLLFITITSCSVIKLPFKALKKINKPSIKKNSSNKLEAFLRNMSNDERKKWYIKTYSKIAVEQMNKYKIPASIILAQGLVESGAGASNLALKSNNHFGIKCHQDWSGKKVYHDDDKKNECFRKYKNVVDSYKDHSEFLSKRGRYSFLFRLPKNDYIKWSYGLKKAGYATAPDYAGRLIKIIEDEMLYQYDREGDFPNGGDLASDEFKQKSGPVLDAKGRPVKNARQRFIVRRMMEAGSRVPFVVLATEERIEYVADSLNLSVAALLQFNDMSWETELKPGDRIYIDEKRGRGATKTTVVRVGETLHEISQREQVKLPKIYKYNGFNVGYQPMAGDEIRLRPVGIIERLQGK